MERNYSIDLIKIIAMYGVIALHTTLNYINDGTLISDILFFTFVISVPLFFMTSGYLLLGREKSDYSYSLKKISNIIKVVSFFVICWWIIVNLKNNAWDIKSLLSNIIYSFFQRGTFWQFWYFGAMIIIYLCYPLLNKIFIHKFLYFIYLTLSLVFIQWIMFNTNMISHESVMGGEISINQTFRLYNWFAYFCFGGIIKRYHQIKISLWFLLLIFSICIIFECFYKNYMPALSPEYFHSSLPGILFSLSFFVYVKGLKIKSNTLIKSLSKLFIPIYAVHPFIILVTNKYWPDCGIFSPITTFLIVSIISTSLSWIFMKIPYINKILRI